jgi:hypothetical protein
MWLKNEKELEPLENKALIDMFNNTYCFYRRRYRMMVGNTVKSIDHPFGDKVIESHINGSYALCVFSGDKSTRFMTIDIDTGGKKAVRQVIEALIKIGIPEDRIYVSISGKKGYHIDLFFSPWIYNEKAKNLYDLVIWLTNLDQKKVEFFPTPTQAIKLPLGIHSKTGSRCWFVDTRTLEPIEDFEYINKIKPIDFEFVSGIIRDWNKKRWNELYAEMICDNSGHDKSVQQEIIFNDEYYLSKRLVMPGTRHDTMVKIARDLRNYGANAPQIEKALKGFYYRQDPVFINSSEREVFEDIEDIASWAEKRVPITHYRPSPNEGIQRRAVLKLEDIESIIKGSTSASRRIALLIYSFCRIFGAAHMSYDYIAKTVGCGIATVKNSLNDLIGLRIINKQSGGCHYQNGKLVRRSNTYFIPECGGKLVADDNPGSFVFDRKIDTDSFNDLYYGAMTYYIKIEDLKNYLTKPELAECKKRCCGEMRDLGG